MEGFFARVAAAPDERFAELFGDAFGRVLDAFDRALAFLRGFAGFRDDEREGFEADFFFDAPRAAEDFLPVFRARLEVFFLPAALPAAFFFFAT